MAWTKKEVIPTSINQLFVETQQLQLRRGLKIAVWGAPEVGKTYFSLTCPEPIYVIDCDWGCLQVASQHFPDKDIKIFEVAVISGKDPTKLDYMATFKKICEAVKVLDQVTEGTIVIDPITFIYNVLNAYVEETATRKTSIGTPQRLEWGIRNALYRNLIFRLISKPCTVVLTAQERSVFTSRGEETADRKPYWLIQTPYWVDVVIHLMKKPTGTTVSYIAEIEKCRYMRTFNKIVPDITYQKLVKILEELGVTVPFR